MKNLVVIFLFLFSLNCFAQDTSNSIDFKFDNDYSTNPTSLYLKCANDIRFSISKDTNLEKLEYKVTGADLIIEDKSKHIVLVPTAAKVTLEVLYNGKTITEQDFKVKLVPKPVVKVEELSDKALREFPQKINVTVSTDETFEKELPRDARYRANNYTISLAKGKEIIAKKDFKENENFTQEEINNYNNLIKAEPNEDWKIIVEINKIQRMNYKNETERVNIENWESGKYFVLSIKAE